MCLVFVGSINQQLDSAICPHKVKLAREKEGAGLVAADRSTDWDIISQS